MLLAPPPPSPSLPNHNGGRGASATPSMITKWSPPSLGRNKKTNKLLVSQNIIGVLFFLVLQLFLTTCEAKEVFTNHFYVKIHPDKSHPDPGVLAHTIAKRNGFHNLGPLLGADDEYHFVHHGLPHARHKRSVPHSRKLKSDPQVGAKFNIYLSVTDVLESTIWQQSVVGVGRKAAGSLTGERVEGGGEKIYNV